MAEPTTTQLKVFHSLWGFNGQWHEAIDRAKATGFDGLEVNLLHPLLKGCNCLRVSETLQASGLGLIMELTTGGDYVPDLSVSPEQHLAELTEQLPRAEHLQPQRITLITGSDSWSEAHQDDFLKAALDLVETCSVPVSFETHRSRTLFNPWTIADRLERHPRLRLTADLSHWCAVSERLMTPELALIRTMANRVDHIHARVGHAQGPSVSHPFAPEAGDALEAHRRCWALFIDSQKERGVKRPTITPEFGPDGYLPTLPFTGMPVADLREINTAMAHWIKQGALNH
jgi:sugar phosphate isomerase/epimerase